MAVIHQELLGKGQFVCCREVIAAVNPQDEEGFACVICQFATDHLRSVEPTQDVNIVFYPMHSFEVCGEICSPPFLYNLNTTKTLTALQIYPLIAIREKSNPITTATQQQQECSEKSDKQLRPVQTQVECIGLCIYSACTGELQQMGQRACKAYSNSCYQ